MAHTDPLLPDPEPVDPGDPEKTPPRAPEERELTDNEVGEAIYAELRRIAEHLLGDGRRIHTLQPTALVHEAYLKLASGQQRWRDERHLRCLVGRAMRQVLVDYARKKARRKRTPPGERLAFDDLVLAYEERSADLVELGEAVRLLERQDPTAALVVDLRFFCAHEWEDVADYLGLEVEETRKLWSFARSWLRRHLS